MNENHEKIMIPIDNLYGANVVWRNIEECHENYNGREFWLNIERRWYDIDCQTIEFTLGSHYFTDLDWDLLQPVSCNCGGYKSFKPSAVWDDVVSKYNFICYEKIDDTSIFVKIQAKFSLTKTNEIDDQLEIGKKLVGIVIDKLNEKERPVTKIIKEKFDKECLERKKNIINKINRIFSYIKITLWFCRKKLVCGKTPWGWTNRE